MSKNGKNPIPRKDRVPLRSGAEKHWFALWNTRRWVEAVIFQGDKLLNISIEVSKQFGNMFERFPSNSSFKENVDRATDFDRVNDIERIERYYFIITLDKARDWIRESIHYEPEILDLLNKIDTELPDIHELRNMSEHEEDYINEIGDFQDVFVKEFEIKEGKAMSDAISASINDFGYIIGGRVNVQHAIKTFSEILLKIQFYEKQMKERLHQL